jgi:hypothetical protein
MIKPNVIHTVNRTNVNILNLNIKYMLTVIAIVGMNGSPGVKNASAYLKMLENCVIEISMSSATTDLTYFVAA